MKKNGVLASIATLVVGASILTTAGFSTYALTKDSIPEQETVTVTASAQNDVFDSGVTSPDADIFDAGIINPFTDCGDSYEKAQEIAGFGFTTREYSNYSIQASKDMIELWVKNHDDKGVTFRKSSNPDYVKGYESVIDGLQYGVSDNIYNPVPDAMFGVRDGKIYSVYFSWEDFSYSIHWDEPVDTMTAILEMGNVIVYDDTANI